MAAVIDDQDLLRDFLAEAGELLEDVDARLVELEARPGDRALLNHIFRGFHTVKGGAGFLQCHALVDLCHRTETLMDQLRDGRLTLSATLLDLILAATGEVRRMFGEMSGGVAPSPAPDALLAAIGAAADPASAPAPAAPAPAAPAPATHAAPAATPAPGPREPDWQRLLDALVAPAGSLLVEAPAAPATVPVPASVTAPAPAAVPVAPKAPRAPKAESQRGDTTIRVETSRFDQILNLSGEIGLTRNRIGYLRAQIAAGFDAAEDLGTAVNRLGMLVTDLQSVVMKARMQPIGRVFQKYARVARDVARSLGKDAELVTIGEETEIDKTILDELNDPLVHLVRNSVDHGLEGPEDRERAGKPRKGTVTLTARQEGDRIVIEVRDDGRGMVPEKLRASALAKGCITAEEAATLDDRQSLQLIFLPGFSTKTEISDVSGRGVGMDVVKTNITKLKGRIELDSTPGRGTTVTIVVPLTLAILPVLMLRSAGQPYAVPLSAVREVITLEEAPIQPVAGKPSLLLRGEVLPVVALGDLVANGAARGDAGVVLQVGNRSFVLATDEVSGRDEVMIKPLEGMKPRGVAGATVSGDGVLVLVLDLHELLHNP